MRAQRIQLQRMRRSQNSVPMVLGAGLLIMFALVAMVAVARMVKSHKLTGDDSEGTGGVSQNSRRQLQVTEVACSFNGTHVTNSSGGIDANTACDGPYSPDTHFLAPHQFYGVPCACLSSAEHCVGRGDEFFLKDADNNLGYKTCGCDPWHDSGAFETVWRIAGIVYLFVGIAIVCDDYFTASLEELSIRFKLSEDVAGATFMAAGSSAPELFTSLAAVFSTPSSECPGATGSENVGVGTIVGSAIFNILIIIGATALLAGNVLQLQYKPLVRDSCFYAASIGLMMLFIIDGMVFWWEALLLILGYVSYIIFMKYNVRLLGELSGTVEDESPDARIQRASVAAIEDEMNDESEKELQKIADMVDGDNGDDERTPAIDGKADAGQEGAGPEGQQEAEENEEEVETFLGCPLPEWPTSIKDKVVTVISYPWYICFMFTVPNCEEGKGWEKWYILTFFMSIIWIGLICHFMVEWAVEIGEINGISKAVMGLTVLSAGTSVPDALSSILVAQRGLGDMAVSNALGSNVFDILLGLGLPYFIANIINIADSSKSGNCDFIDGVPNTTVTPVPVCMCVNDVAIYIVALSIVLVIVVGSFAAFKFQLHPRLGYILIITYILFGFGAIARDQDLIDLGKKCEA